MTIFWHEMKRGRISLLVWTAAIALLSAACILIYPEMGDQIGEVSEMFSNMGSFSAAFGMDQIHFGEFIGFFAVECGNIFGLGGAFFSGLLGVSALSKEEKDHTAEFLLSHPISRTQVIGEKGLAVAAQILILNLVSVGITVLSIFLIHEEVDMKTLGLLFLSYFLMQIQIGAMTFGISAFLRKESLGLGLGLAVGFYFLNLIANLVKETEFLKYLTPFGYTEGADIITKQALNGGYLTAGMVFGVIGIGIAFWQYGRKDIG